MAFFRGLTAVSRLRSRVAQEASALGGVRWLQMQSASDLDLKSQLQELIPEQQDRLKKLKSEHGKVQLGNINVDMVLGGMRGMIGMLWETSLLDPEEGIRFRFSFPLPAKSRRFFVCWRGPEARGLQSLSPTRILRHMFRASAPRTISTRLSPWIFSLPALGFLVGSLGGTP